MSQSRKNPVSFTATAAIAAFRRVKLTSGSGTAVEYAGAGESAIGVSVSAAAITEMVLVSLFKAGETHKVTCSAGVAVGASLYGTANGKVDDTGTGATIGVALEAGSGDDSVIEAILDQDSAQGLAHIVDVAASTQAALTDNGGGTADGTVASMAAPTTLTDSTGGSGTHDDTLAAVTAPTTITDSTGLNATHDDTVAAVAVAAGTLGGSADGTLELVGATNGGDVSGAIHNNFQDLRAAILVNSQNCSDLGQKVIELVTLAGVLAQNESDLGQKVIELVTLATAIQNNMKEVTTQLAAAKADSDAQVTKINAILARLEAAGINAAA